MKIAVLCICINCICIGMHVVMNMYKYTDYIIKYIT